MSQFRPLNETRKNPRKMKRMRKKFPSHRKKKRKKKYLWKMRNQLVTLFEFQERVKQGGIIINHSNLMAFLKNLWVPFHVIIQIPLHLFLVMWFCMLDVLLHSLPNFWIGSSVTRNLRGTCSIDNFSSSRSEYDPSIWCYTLKVVGTNSIIPFNPSSQI